MSRHQEQQVRTARGYNGCRDKKSNVATSRLSTEAKARPDIINNKLQLQELKEDVATSELKSRHEQ